jgi:hypothetical protein
VKPSGQPQRRTPLRSAQRALTRRGEQLAPRRAPAYTGPARDTTAAVYERDQGCLLAGFAIPAAAAPGGSVVLPCVSDVSKQHRYARKSGGSSAPWINDPYNLATLCGDGTRGHHAYVEDFRTVGQRLGLIVRMRRTEQATRSAVLLTPVYYRGRWVLLTEGATLIELCPFGPGFEHVDDVIPLAARVLGLGAQAVDD